MTHICVSKLTIIGSENDLSPGRRQAIIWTNAGILLIWTLGTNFSEILREKKCIFIQENAFENVVWNMTAFLSRPQCVKIFQIHARALYLPVQSTTQLYWMLKRTKPRNYEASYNSIGMHNYSWSSINRYGDKKNHNWIMELHDLEVCHLRHSIQLGKIKTILYSAKISLPDFYLLQMFLTCTFRHTILHFTRIQIIEKYSRLGSVSLTVFRRNSNSMEISFFSYIDSNLMVATKCCTWYDSCAVMVCAKVCCDLIP